MGYYDPPEDYPEFEGCPLCHSDEWIEFDDNDRRLETCTETFYCGNCGITLDFANQHWDKLIAVFDEPEPDLEIPEPKSDNYWEEDSEYELQRLKESGLVDELGNPTPEYYALSDFQYDCWRESRL